MARVLFLMYVQIVLEAIKVKTMTLIRNRNVAPEIISKTECDMNYACLSGNGMCNAELFLDGDLPFLRCREERSCVHKKAYRDIYICTCPVNRASFSLN